MSPTVTVENGTCSLFIHKSLRMNGGAVRAEPHTVMAILNQNNPRILSSKGGMELRGEVGTYEHKYVSKGEPSF